MVEENLYESERTWRFFFFPECGRNGDGGQKMAERGLGGAGNDEEQLQFTFISRVTFEIEANFYI